MKASGKGVRHWGVKATNTKKKEVQILIGMNQEALALKFKTDNRRISIILSGRGENANSWRQSNVIGDWRLVVLNMDMEPEPSEDIQNGY